MPRKKNIQFLGRAGIIYTLNGVKYFIDSEMLYGKFDIAISSKSIYLNDNKESNLDDNMKQLVLDRVIDELKKEGLKFIID